jgi:hypothetical protein
MKTSRESFAAAAALLSSFLGSRISGARSLEFLKITHQEIKKLATVC